MAFYRKAGFWVGVLAVVAVGHKFYGLDRPLLGHHAWRQADTAALARNYHAGGMKFFYPQVDWGGPGPNYCETEFPLYSYVAAATYFLTGPADVVGRVLSLAAYLLQLLLIYAIGKRLLNPRAALAAAFLFALSPVGGFMGRAFMPESWRFAASLGAVYFLCRWLEDRRTSDFFDAAAALALAALLKPTAFHLLPLFVLLALRYAREELRSPAPWLVLAGTFVPAAMWYWHAHRLFERTGLTFGVWVAGDKWATAETLLSVDFYRKMLTENLAANVLTIPGLILAVAGVVLLVAHRSRYRFALLAWLGVAVGYLLVLARGAYYHDYYALPLLAPAALAGGYAASEGLKLFRRNVPGKAAAVVTGLALAAAVPAFTGKFRSFIRVNEAPLRAGEYLLTVDREGAPIVTYNDGGPQWLYYCGRKGWILSPKGPLAEDAALMDDFLQRYYAEGARYLVVDINYYGLMSNDLQRYLDEAHERLALREGFAAWRLAAAAKP
ncbi:MAG: glycosyltransferase family 39 protein [Candidatus Coatesbacteria bacterium]|nr:MAG: glycosyltransferase family 39 protein [Candidatus Coatesbacteria bacterium]